MKNELLLQHLKCAVGKSRTQLCLPIGKPIIACMRPLGNKIECLDANDIAALTQWRNRFTTSYLTEFTATCDQTAKWVAELIGQNPNRILFMIDDLNGRSLGSMGLVIHWQEDYVEADAIVRGEEGVKGMMTQALRSLRVWAREALQLNGFGIRVRSDNPAEKFYIKLGFQEVKRIPIKKTTELNKICWIEDPNLRTPALSVIYMRLD